MNRNRIIKVILGVLTVLLVAWFCVLSYQDGYARDYGRSAFYAGIIKGN